MYFHSACFFKSHRRKEAGGEFAGKSVCISSCILKRKK
ncbi:MAG: zinc-finger domain-containing protein [Selenomonas artemidis]